MDILDQILGAEMANEYTDSQRLAYAEKKVLTYDGNVEDRIQSGNGYAYFAKVSDEVIDVASVKTVFFTTQNGAVVQVDINSGNSKITEGDGHDILLINLKGEELPVLVTVSNEYILGSVGTFVVGSTAGDIVGYISRVEYGETVHKIDPKFIPNTTYIIDLDELFNNFDLMEALMLAISNGGTYVSTGYHREMENLQKIAPGTAVFASAVVDGVKCVTHCSVVVNEGEIYQFGFSSIMTQITNGTYSSIKLSLSVSSAVIVLHAEIVANGVT